MFTNGLPKATKEELQFITDGLHRADIGHDYLTHLMWVMSRINTHCGNPNCQNECCLAVREGREMVGELLVISGLYGNPT